MDRLVAIDADPDTAEIAVQREPDTPDCVDEMGTVRFPYAVPDQRGRR